MDRLTREVVRHYLETCSAMEEEAGQYETGAARHFTGDLDDSVIQAEELRHRARNIQTMVQAVARLAQW
jgi:hypothetical protein